MRSPGHTKYSPGTRTPPAMLRVVSEQPRDGLPGAPARVNTERSWSERTLLEPTTAPGGLGPGQTSRPVRSVAVGHRPHGPTRGGGGDRTRVLQYITRASPGAACS